MHSDKDCAPQSNTRRKGFLNRLLRDSSGNTLAIVGAALIPLTAMIGSGVDMSRAYMAKTRLQSACDAAALAGRRVMVNDSLGTNVTPEAIRFFNFNFPQGLYETASFTPTVTRPAAGTVRVTASTTIPTAVMNIFGFETLPLNVTCDASLNFVNTEILLVLDTTGSMLEDINGNSTSVVADQKITALKDAVLALYDELAPIQTQLEANGLRLRYGIVPYSSTVNVGGLIREVNADYLRDDVAYQSRYANYSTHHDILGTPEAPVVQYYNSGASISQNNCDKYGRNVSFSGFSPSATSGGGPPPTATWSRTFSNNEQGGVDWGYPGAPDTSGDNRSCRRYYVETDTTYSGYEFTNWVYTEEDYDVSTFNGGGSVTYAIAGAGGNPGGYVPTAGNYDMLELAAQGTGITTTTGSWGGCIMERDTDATIPAYNANNSLAVPSGAWDLNINHIPDNDATRWRAYWPEISYYRSSWNNLTDNSTGSGQRIADFAAFQFSACPAPARKLDAMTRAQMETYLGTLNAIGYTYHDIGMIWGARMISTGGIFARACETYNGMPCSRHVIFMTDGALNTSTPIYSAYGVEGIEERVSGSQGTGSLTEMHRQRFLMACNAARQGGASVWVVAFAQGLDASLTSCASNANQASTSANRAQLIARFREIGSNIGALRLTQ